MHPTIIAEAFIKASTKAVEYLTEISMPVDLRDQASLLRAASTSLNSKVCISHPILLQSLTPYDSLQIVSQYSSTLAPIAVAAVTRLATATSSNVDLRDVRIVKKVGGTIEDTELVEGGVVLHQNVVVAGGGPTRIEKAKIGLIQFQLSAPKPDVCHSFKLVVHLQSNVLPSDGQHGGSERLSANG